MPASAFLISASENKRPPAHGTGFYGGAMPMISTDAAILSPQAEPAGGAVADLTMWLRDLDECRRGGFLADEDFAYQRAEKLDELLVKPRRLWLGWVLAGLPLAVVAGSLAWLATANWMKVAMGAGIAGVWGLSALGRMTCEHLRHVQLRERLGILRELLAHDLVSAEEFSAFEERLHDGKLAEFS